VKKKMLFIAVGLLLAGASAFAQGEKIGYVDSQIILTQYPAAIKAQGDLDALTNLWSAQLSVVCTIRFNDPGLPTVIRRLPETG
jgi:outer membrane protein